MPNLAAIRPRLPRRAKRLLASLALFQDAFSWRVCVLRVAAPSALPIATASFAMVRAAPIANTAWLLVARRLLLAGFAGIEKR